MFSAMAVVAPVAKAAPPKDFKGIRIVIDPGHGGHDGGAMAPNGLTEKFVNLSVSKHLANMLKKAGATVALTRSNDKFVSLAGRADIANKFKAQRFIAVHQNGAANKNANGTETYHHKPQAAKLSKLVQEEMLKALGHSNRGSRKAAFAVIRQTKMPAVLTEASFISQPKEAAKLVNPAYRQKQAMAIFKALQREFGIKPQVPQPVQPKAVKPAEPQRPEKPVKPAKLQVQFTGKLGVVENKKVDTQVHIPYVTGSDNLISIRNIGGQMAQPKIVFKDVLGQKIQEMQPFLDAANSFSFYPQNIVGQNFFGSVDVLEPMGQISSGLSAGIAE